MTKHFDVIVIGAGAAGLMCALTAGQRGRRVALLEHNDEAGRKIVISGGGRCNFTNLQAGPEHYLSDCPEFAKSALARYTPWDFVALVEKHHVAYHEKKLGQQFCDESARRIVDLLLAECAEGDVEVRCGCRVQQVSKSDRFVLGTSQGELTCDSLVIATGGLSFPKLGATDFGHCLARQFGLVLTELRPGLVPLTFSGADHPHYHALSGLSLPVVARHGGTSFEEQILFTHRGLSGPAILQISSFLPPGGTVHFDLLPGSRGSDLVEAERRGRGDLPGALARHWPRRFAETWTGRHVAPRPLAQQRRAELDELASLLHAWPFTPAGTEGYPKAEVTIGGVSTRELSSKTMETRRVKGLYFIGEVVDVTGWLGGYNFQWAWASGHAAGEAA